MIIISNNILNINRDLIKQNSRFIINAIHETLFKSHGFLIVLLPSISEFDRVRSIRKSIAIVPFIELGFRARGSTRQVGGTEVISFSYIKHEERHYVALPLFDLSARLSRRYFAASATRRSTEVRAACRRGGANERTPPS